LHTYTASKSDIRSFVGLTLTFDISDIDSTGSIPITNMGIGVIAWSEDSDSAGYYRLTSENFYIESNIAGTVSVYIKLTGDTQRAVSATIALYVPA
jgi:hypothetical protein